MSLARRTLLAAAAAAAVAGCAAPRPRDNGGLTFTPGRTLRTGMSGYAGSLRDTIGRYLRPTPDHPGHPSYAGAVVLAAVDGVIGAHHAVGDALRYTVGPRELPPTQRVPMRPDAIFDLASITKIFTSIVALQQAERGRLALDAPVADYLPEFVAGPRGAAKEAVSVRMLLAHTSGLPDVVDLARSPSGSARRQAILATPLVLGLVPGTAFRYSDVGMMTLGLLVERATGVPLPALVADGITRPLGMVDTGFVPLERLGRDELAARMVATEAKRGRGLVRGAVHDENAALLGGVAGHAGLFGTAADLAILGQTLVNGGEYRGARVLAEPTVRLLLTNANAHLPVGTRRAAHGLGVELDQPWYMGRLAAPATCGHTGFTGTSIVVDPVRRAVVVLLTNRVHPDRSFGGINPTRAAVADLVANSIGG